MKDRVVWLVPAFLAVHNSEEALMFKRYLPVVQSRAPASLGSLAATVTNEQMLIALVVATAVPFAIALWAWLRPESSRALWTLVLVQMVMLINVGAHLTSALFLRGYAPGLVTAVGCNLPFSIYLIRRAHRERWIGEQSWRTLVLVAIIVHGPLLLGLVVLSGRFASNFDFTSTVG